MKLSQAVLILLILCTRGALSFIFGNGKDIGRRNVNHELEPRGATALPDPKTAPPPSALTSIQGTTPWNTSQVLSYTSSYASIPLSGKGLKTGLSTSKDYTQILSPISILTTAKGLKPPPISSFLATSTALGVFTTLSPPSTVTVSPRVTGIPILSLVSTTNGGTTGVDVTILSQPSAESDMASSTLSTSAPVDNASSSGDGVVTILSPPDEPSSISGVSPISPPAVSFAFDNPQASTTASTNNVVFTDEVISTSLNSVAITGNGFVTVFASAVPPLSTSLILATVESEVQQTNSDSTFTGLGSGQTPSINTILVVDMSSNPPASPASIQTNAIIATTLLASFVPMTSMNTNLETNQMMASTIVESTLYPFSSAPAISSSSTPTLSISIPPGTELPMPSPTIVKLSGQYTYIGCFTEGADQRALRNASFPNDGNTIALCVSQCYPFKYSGAEYGRECWCGDALEGGSLQVLESECTMPCAGDAGEVCGDSMKLSLYELAGNSTTVQTSSSQAAFATTAAISPQAVSNTPSGSSTTTEVVSITVSPFQALSEISTEPASTTNSPSTPTLAVQTPQPSVSVLTTAQFMNTNSITLSLTLPAQPSTTTFSLLTIQEGCTASIFTVIDAAGPATLPTSSAPTSDCNCAAQVTLTITKIQTIAFSANETGTWSAPSSPYSALSDTSTITRNWILEAATSWTEASIRTPSWLDTTMTILEGSSTFVEIYSAGATTVGTPVFLDSSSLVAETSSMGESFAVSHVMSTSNTVKGTTENASSTSSNHSATPTPADSPTSGAGRSDGSLKLWVLLGGVALVLVN